MIESPGLRKTVKQQTVKKMNMFQNDQKRFICRKMKRILGSKETTIYRLGIELSSEASKSNRISKERKG